ncbi:MAG TPA: FAD-dependent oxidoreductase [Polyangiaceae bacterium]|nr:FAD-dependent oxidoreductase [Polyangiaceae bacterium]
MTAPTFRVAVVGGGLAGLACAHALAGRGLAVALFDKGRAAGGRLAARATPGQTFDLGAQYFTVRDEHFARRARLWRTAGACAPWAGRIVALDGAGGPPRPVEPIERWVGTPDMGALARLLARGLPVRSGHRVERLTRHAGGLALRGTVAPAGVGLGPAPPGAAGDEDFGTFDGVALCLPPAQAVALLEGVSPRLAGRAAAVEFDPCLALAFAAGEADEAALRALGFDGAFVGREGAPSGSPLSWVARDSSKPRRPPGERWVLHASAAWSRARFDLPEAETTDAMLAAFAATFGLAPPRPAFTRLRRWAFARAPRPLDVGALFDDDARVGLGGDWASGGRVEGAFLSGVALAERLLGAARGRRLGAAPPASGAGAPKRPEAP